MISLDGSTLEGGGQLVRVALALSAITSTPVHLYNIRANRTPRGNSNQQNSKPSGGGSNYNRRHNNRTNGNNSNNSNRSSKRIEGGLKESHLASLQWLAEQTDASVEGDELGSREVKFKPRVKQKRPGPHQEGADKHTVIELKNPGSVWLILQAILPYVVFRMARQERVHFSLKGGTNVDKSMSGEYVQQVLLPTLQKIGLPADVQVEIVKRGWAGGVAPGIGEVKVSVQTRGEGEEDKDLAVLNSFQVVDRGCIEKIGVSIVARPESLRRQVVDRVRQQVNERLASHGSIPGSVPVEVVVDDDSGDASRFYLLLVAHTTSGWRIGRDFLGRGGKIRDSAQVESQIETAVKSAVDDLDTELRRGGCVDELLQDQLAIFQALARGRRSVVDAGAGRGQGTLHTQTARWVCQEMMGTKFGEDGVCEG